MKLIKNSPFVLLLAAFRYPTVEDFLWTLGFFMHIKVVRVININLQLGDHISSLFHHNAYRNHKPITQRPSVTEALLNVGNDLIAMTLGREQTVGRCAVINFISNVTEPESRENRLLLGLLYR